jgi:GNAT superfamily N-acetyltransferase
MSVLIREAGEVDVPALLSFIKELAAFEKLTHEVTATETDLRATLFGKRPFAEALIAEVDGVTAGMAVYFYSYSTFLAKPGLYLEDLYVSPKFRGRGIGKKLIASVAKVALSRGCARYEWSVLDWNTPAIEFYKNLGAEMHGDWRRMRIMGSALVKMAGMD